MRKLMLLVLVTLTLLFSCQLQKVAVNVYTPSKLAFPPEVRSVLVTSRFVPATGPYEDVQWGAYETVDSVKWKLAELMVDTLAKQMSAGNKFLVKARHFPRMLRHNEASMPDPVPWGGLSILSKKEYVQALLIIEGFGVSKTPVSITPNAGAFIAQFSVGITMAVRIYEPEKMRMIDDSVYTFTSVFKGEGKTGQEAAMHLPDDGKSLPEACSNAANS